MEAEASPKHDRLQQLCQQTKSYADIAHEIWIGRSTCSQLLIIKFIWGSQQKGHLQ